MKLDLLGKKFPVKNENNEIVVYKTIVNYLEFENSTGVVIVLEGSGPHTGIVVSYLTAIKLSNGEEL